MHRCIRCNKKTDDDSDICFDCELEEREFESLSRTEFALRKALNKDKVIEV